MRSLTFEIEPTDCVGDSVGKHNYNILAIDTLICNISSESFLGQDSILTWFNELSSMIPNLNWLASNFSSQAISSYQLNHNVIQTLSSYWDTSEFTVMYEYNIYTPDSYNNGVISDGIVPTNNYISTAFYTLSTQMLSYLNNKFPVKSYNLGTRANVVMPIFTTPINTSGNIHGTVFVPLTGNDYAYPNGVVNNATSTSQINTYAIAALGSKAIGSYTSYNDDYQFHNVYSNAVGQLGNIIPASTKSLENYNRTIKVEYGQNNVYMQSLYTVKFIAAIDPNLKIPAWISYDAILT